MHYFNHLHFSIKMGQLLTILLKHANLGWSWRYWLSWQIPNLRIWTFRFSIRKNKEIVFSFWRRKYYERADPLIWNLFKVHIYDIGGNDDQGAPELISRQVFYLCSTYLSTIKFLRYRNMVESPDILVKSPGESTNLKPAEQLCSAPCISIVI